MPAEIGGSQISSLLEALPGIASVLRSPVADALIKAMRAAAGLADFTPEDAEELVRFAVRRGLIGPDEGDRVLAEVQEGLRKKILEAIDRGMPKSEAAKTFGVSRFSVKRYAAARLKKVDHSLPRSIPALARSSTREPGGSWKPTWNKALLHPQR